MVVPRRHLRIVVQNDVDLLQGGRKSSVWADTNFPQIQIENGENQKAKFVRNNNAEGLRKTSQGSLKVSL